MSAESPADSRPPQTNSAIGDSGSETEVSESACAKSLDNLPSPEEKLSEFLEEFGAQAHVPLSTEHGRRLRPECFDEVKETKEVTTEEGETVEVEEVQERTARPLWQGVANMLQWHVDYHKSTLRLEYGEESDPTHTLLDVDLDNSWFAEYQNKERAKLKALERETCGFETCDECDTRYCSEPDEHETVYVEGAFEEPVVALTGRTARGAGRPPVDHAREIAEAWADDGVRRSLRYEIDKLGLSREDWVRWTQGEPHPGSGENQGYHHAHDIIILDAAQANGEITAATFRPVIESHVEKCDHAGAEAHDLNVADWDSAPSTSECGCGNGCEECVGTVSVRYVEEDIEESVASYAAAYLANEEKDLLERPPEYLAWAATMWATGTQKGIKTDSANHAIAADRCKHQHAEGEQETAHGEQVTYSDKRGCKAECAMCGSPWGVEQKDTLVAAKRVAGPDVGVADGGATEGDETDAQTAEEEFRERYPIAREGARVGGEATPRPVSGQREGNELEGVTVRLGGGESYCAACRETEPDEGGECTATAYRESEYEDVCPLPPEHFGEHTIQEGAEYPDATVTTGSEQYRGDGHVPFEYERPPEHDGETVSFVRPPKWKAKSILRDGEEIPATGGTAEKEPLDLPSAPVRVVSMAAESGGVAVCQECGRWLDSPGEVVSHSCESDIHVGWLPATEPPAEEATVGYSEFVEAVPEQLRDRDDGGETEESEAVEVDVPVGRIREFVEHRPDVSVVGVLGEFGLPPSAREDVAVVME